MKVLALAILLFLLGHCRTMETVARNDNGNGPKKPSLNHINFIAAIIGTYGKTSVGIEEMTIPTQSSLIITPVTTKIMEWPQGSTLYAEEFQNNVVVGRSLYISVEKDNNTIMFYPCNFTSDFTTIDQDFRFSKFNSLLVTQLDYSHNCDRVVKPSTTRIGAFDFVSWPHCSASFENPPIFSAVVTCNQIKVSFTDVRLPPSPADPFRKYFVLEKTKKAALPKYYSEGQDNYVNPCSQDLNN